MKWHLIKNKEIAYQLKLAKIGNEAGESIEICPVEALYCKGIGLETGIKVKAAARQAPLLRFYKTIRDAGRVGLFDRRDESVFFMFPPGNDRKQEIEYAAVVCGTGKQDVAAAFQKAIAIGRKTRKDAIVASCSSKACRFFKIREMYFEPVSR